LPNNEHLVWLHSSGLQASCHNFVTSAESQNSEGSRYSR
jgi:hypothetical protein